MKTSHVMLLSCALAISCALANPSYCADGEGLMLSVHELSVEAGSSVDLHWEIAPDGQSAVSIILGVILPNGEIEYYRGLRNGFTDLETIASASPIATDFPFNTKMSGVLEVPIPEDWPHGTSQFVAAVMEGKTVIEIVYSNSFVIE